jgi:lysophospholipase L1-like esterase
VLASWQNTTLAPDRRELVVFCFGTNDAVLHVPVDRSLDAMGEALRRADELAAPAFVIGPPPIGDMPAEDLHLRSLSDALAGVAAAAGAPFISTFDRLGPDSIWRAEAEAGDGSHPGAGGYSEMADFLEESGLVEWLTKMSSR